MNFKLPGELTTAIELRVPILVSSDPAVADDPIIGYNVIEAFINRKEGRTAIGRK